MAYTTAYMEAYRSPHESPTGSEGATSQIVTLKMENTKLRINNKEMAEEIIRLRQQLSYIRVASQPRFNGKKRPPPIDLSGVPEYHPLETRPSVGRISAAVGDAPPPPPPPEPPSSSSGSLSLPLPNVDNS